MTHQIRFETLGAAHKRDDFTCGNQVLDQWFRTRASQDQKRHVAQVFVALHGDQIVGFYSLSMFTLALDSLPAPLPKKLPKYDAIPAAIIGRLARADRERGKGIGGLLVADAIKRVLAASESVAAYAIVVDAKDDEAKHFYEAFGFIPLASKPRRLFLMTQTAAAAFAVAERP